MLQSRSNAGGDVVAANPQMLRLGRSFAAFPGKVNSGKSGWRLSATRFSRLWKTEKGLVEEQIEWLQMQRRSPWLDPLTADSKTGGAAAFHKIARRFYRDFILTR